MKALITNIYILIFLASSHFVKSQDMCDTLPFILCDQNQIVVNNPDSNLTKLIHKIQRIKNGSSEKIQMVHIGDSHLQAGFLTEKIKQILFQYISPEDSFASPGFIFPYTVAQTNNPFFYKVDYTGNWKWCKNVDAEKKCSLGLSGITVRTNNSNVSMSIKMQNQKYTFPIKYYFNKVKLLHNSDSSIHVKINGIIADTQQGYSYLLLEKLTDSISVCISHSDTSKYVELYGIILENDESKINYHTIGVNGATAQSYLKCEYFSDHLSAIQPDLVILSLGTNEAYDRDFASLKYEFELKDLIYQIRDIAPDAAIILTTPNDHLKDRKIINPNILEVRNTILKITDEFHVGAWDFYSIMGGENSIQNWYNKGLTGEDKLHFKRIGYEIQGELFAKAFFDLIEKDKLK